MRDHIAFLYGANLDFTRMLVGDIESTLPSGWSAKFSTGPPTHESSVYPSKDELLDALSAQHDRNTDAFLAADASLFSSPHPNEQTRAVFPTMGDLIIFMMTVHEGDHLGQIAAWRRAMARVVLILMRKGSASTRP